MRRKVKGATASPVAEVAPESAAESAPEQQAAEQVRAALVGVPEEGVEARLEALLREHPEDGLLWQAGAKALAYRRRWLRAAALFASAAARLPDPRRALCSRALCLLAGGRTAAAREAMGGVLKRYPQDPDAPALFGFAELQQGNPTAAALLLDRAAERAPRRAPVWAALGRAYAATGRPAAAAAAFRRALRLDPADIDTWAGRAQLLRLGNETEAAAAVLGECRAARPEAAAALAWQVEMARIEMARFRFAEAGELLRAALAAQPEYLEARLSMSLLHFLSGDWKAAWEDYRWRHRTQQIPKPFAGVREWAGEDPAGMSLLVRCEQGFGDIFHFARYLPLLAARGAGIRLLGVPVGARSLLAALPGVSFQEPGQAAPDAQVALLDLPRAMGLPAPGDSDWSTPYLSPPPGPGLPAPAVRGLRRVGVAWAGNPRHTNDANRSVGVERFLRLAGQAGVAFFSFQTGPAAAALERSGGETLIMPLQRDLQDFAATASRLRDVDLLITVDTAVAHLAGAMGVATWLLLPNFPDWRWGGVGESTPWYPSLRLFRQPQPGDWDAVFERVADELAAWVGPAALVCAEDEATEQAAVFTALRQKVMASGWPPPGETRRRVLGPLLARFPRLAGAWVDLGVVLRRAEFFEAAVACYRRALGYGGAPPGVHVNMGNALNDLGRAEEAAAAHRRALDADPNAVPALHGLSISQRLLGDLPGNLESLRRALAIDAAHTGAQWDFCNSLLAVGDYKTGWAMYRKRWQQPDAGSIPYDGPIWDGSDPKGRTLLVFAEQGFGDTILAARFLPALRARGARIVVACQPELMRLIARMGVADRVVPKATPFRDYDLICPMMDLPGFLLDSPDGIPEAPYLVADPALAGLYADVFRPAGAALRVGIVWSGSVTFKGNRLRAATLDDFLPLAEVPGVALYSLQKGPPQEALENARIGSMITDLSPLLTDFDATAAILAELDLVLMTDSSVAHLAGALGRPVWNLLGPRAYWLWELAPERSPWYPSMRLFRRPLGEDWRRFMAGVCVELATVAADRSGLRHAGPVEEI